MATTIDNLLKLIPLIGFLLIGSGVVKLMLYFKAFRIRIFSFLNLQEVLVSFTDNLIPFFLILILTSITGFIFYKNLEVNNLTIETLKAISFSQRSLAYIKVNWVIILIILLLSIVTIIFWCLRENIFLYEAIAIILVLWLSLFIAPIFINEINLLHHKNNQQPLNFNYLAFAMGTIALFLYVTGSAYNEINKVKKFNYFKGSEFIIDGLKIVSTEKYYYVGQTSKFIFFYNAKCNYSEIYPIEKVEKFKFIR